MKLTIKLLLLALMIPVFGVEKRRDLNFQKPKIQKKFYEGSSFLTTHVGTGIMVEGEPCKFNYLRKSCDKKLQGF